MLPFILNHCPFWIFRACSIHPLSSRLKERTSWDGAALITAGVCFLLFKGIATLVAYAAIAYGAWTLWKEEYKD